MDTLVRSVPDAADAIGVSPRTLYGAIARGEFPAVKIGRRLVVPEVLLRRFLEQGAIQGSELEEVPP